MAVDIVELEFDVRVPVPIQADRVFAVTAALHKVIIQVEVAVTIEEFPGAPTAVPAAVFVFDHEEILARLDAVVFAEPLVVAAVLAGQEPAALGIGAVIKEVAARRCGGGVRENALRVKAKEASDCSQTGPQ